MRLAMTLIVFLFVGVTIAGSALTALLSLDFTTRDVEQYLPWFVGGGFAIALPVSYLIAGSLLRRISRKGNLAS